MLDIPVRETIDIAAAAGFGAMSLWVNSPTPAFVAPCLVEREAALAVARRLRDAGMRVCNLEVFRVGPDTDVSRYEGAIALGAELGAATATVIAKDGSDGTAETLSRFAHLAAAYDIRVNVEFLSYRGPCSLEEALDLVTRTGDSGVGILIDILHLVRSGGSIEAVGALDPAIIGHVQLCDGPLGVPETWLEHESASDRMLPGTGQFPLGAFVETLPSVALGLEIPRMSAAFRGLAPAARVSSLLGATLSCFHQNYLNYPV